MLKRVRTGEAPGHARVVPLTHPDAARAQLPGAAGTRSVLCGSRSLTSPNVTAGETRSGLV